jgi:cardiolipin synthase
VFRDGGRLSEKHSPRPRGPWVSPVSLPNAVTFFRVLLIPTYATAFIYDYDRLALTMFVVAGISDALDGFLARRSHSQSRLGSFLDPMADKLLLLTAFTLLGMAHIVPLWMVILVFTRDIIIVGGWTIGYVMTNHTDVQPTTLGKGTTVFQVVAVMALQVDHLWPLPEQAALRLLDVAMALTALSGIDYLVRGLKELEARSHA